MTDRSRRTCECGRSFDTYGGVRIHERSCVTERARSRIFVDAVQENANPHEAVARWQVAGRPA